jgi:hypothetical protein
MNNEIVFKWYLKLFDSLNNEFKLKLITQLLDRFRDDYTSSLENQSSIPSNLEKNKADRAKALFGVWKDDPMNGDELVLFRTVSEREYDL